MPENFTKSIFQCLATAACQELAGIAEKQQRGTPDITQWLVWFLGCLERALLSAEKALAGVLFKAEVWQRLQACPVNACVVETPKRVRSPNTHILR